MAGAPLTQPPEPGAGWLDRALALAPLLFGVPVLSGVALSAAGLLTTPDLVAGAPSAGDALALYLGEPIHGDPADGYVGSIYTPLYAAVVSLLHRVALWQAWPYLVTLAGSLALAAMAARLAYRPASAAVSDRLVAAAGAVGIGALAWWLVSTVHFDYLWTEQPDHPAWALAIGGLLLVPRAADGSRAASVAAILLLSAGFWTKQPAAAAAIAAVGWLLVALALGQVGRRFVAAFAGGLALVNLLVLALLSVLTDGWEAFYDFGVGLRQYQSPLTLGGSPAAGCDCGLGSLAGLAREIVITSALPLGFALALAAAAAWPRLRRHRPRSGVRHRRAALALAVASHRRTTLMLAFVVVALVVAAYVRRKQGTHNNQELGLVWGLALLGAMGYGRCRRRRDTAALAAAAVALLFLLVQLRPTATEPPVEGTWRVTGIEWAPLHSDHRWATVPAELRRLARRRIVYHPFAPDINVRSHGLMHPPVINIADLLSAGRVPEHFVRSLLDRRFDVVMPFARVPGHRLRERYVSGYGKWEENFLWKLDRVVRARYRPEPGLLPGMVVRRPGPERDEWMRACFAPFEIGGHSFVIGRGGGFWCRSGAAVTLRDTPAPVSELRSDGPVRVAGGAAFLSFARAGGTAVLSLEREDGRGWRVRHTAARPEGPIALRPPPGEGVLRLRATRGSGASLDLRGLELER